MAEAQRVRNQAPFVCMTCRTAKRQCDKLLPTCSRCRKLNRACQYAAASTSPIHEPVLDTETASLAQEQSAQSCTRCKTYKRKCDRLVPSCSRCSRLTLDCNYGAAKELSSQSLPGCAGGGIRIHYSDTGGISYTLLGPSVSFDPPITYRPYMPMLLQFFGTSANLPPGIAIANSLKHHLASTWMKHAMADPCLFHATLFSAAASIDILMGRQATTVTLYHQTSTIQMLSERLNQEFPLLTYGTLGSVLPLIFYNMVALDQHSAVLHQKGLIKMLLATPKSLIDELGPLIGVIKLTMLSYSCVFDTPPVWDCLHAEFGRSTGILRSLVSSSTFHKGGPLFEKETIESILDVYEAFSKLDQSPTASAPTIATQLEQVLTLPRNDSFSDLLESEDLPMDNVSRMNACCRLSCLIFWELLRSRSQAMLNISVITDRVKLLKDSMAKVSHSFWIRKAPEAFTWITFTGAAGCINANDRGTLIHRGSAVLTAVDSESLTLMTQGWNYFSLLRRISGLCTSSLGPYYQKGIIYESHPT